MGDTILTERGRALVSVLLNARRTGVPVDLSATGELELSEAMAVQLAVMHGLDDTAPLSKVALNQTGVAIAAPILSRDIYAPGQAVSQPTTGFRGLEVEIAVRLGRDLTPDLARDGRQGLISAIDGVYLGVELLGSRLANPKTVDANFALADNLTNAAYILQTTYPWTSGLDVEGLPVEVLVDGETVFSGPARHPFGGVLVALERYALYPFDLYGCCKAGQLITTGTLSGIVPVPKSGRVLAKLGNSTTVNFGIV